MVWRHSDKNKKLLDSQNNFNNTYHMKNLIVFISFVFIGSTSFASSNYISGGIVLLAVQAEFEADNTDVDAGLGETSCALCHTSASSGGLGTMNSTFGSAFSANANSQFGQGHGLNQTQIQAVLAAIAGDDADGDGTSNGAEFAANTSPAAAAGSGGGSSDDGGGCGMISTGKTMPPGGGPLLLLLPLALIALMWTRREQQA